jgi:DNA-binding Xre family transcriptional regulator
MAGTVRFRVDKILDARGIKAEEFADQAGIHYRTALDIVYDRTQRIDKDTLAKICDALKVTPADVLEYTPG